VLRFVAVIGVCHGAVVFFDFATLSAGDIGTSIGFGLVVKSLAAMLVELTGGIGISAGVDGRLRSGCTTDDSR
jgi:hypothetical protein